MRKSLPWTTHYTRKEMTYDELVAAILKILPEAQLDEDLDGQVVIYSGLEEKPNGKLEKFSPREDG